VRHYPCDHFDVFGAGDWTAPAAQHQAEFVSEILAGDREPATA
jgi:hypothetical protein